ncbi:MAG: hypothetical protein HYU65_10075, partial [Armatimonadetes bacterium]|nr:hypothetical protein [Armatimonadota bacterium]
PDRLADFQALSEAHGIPVTVLGHTGGTRLRIDIAGNAVVDLPLDELVGAYSALDEVFS